MKATQKQKEIIELMKSGYQLLTTQGANYACWLRDAKEERVSIQVGRSTCESMDRKGLIKPKHDTKSRFFEWKLA